MAAVEREADVPDSFLELPLGAHSCHYLSSFHFPKPDNLLTFTSDTKSPYISRNELLFVHLVFSHTVSQISNKTIASNAYQIV